MQAIPNKLVRFLLGAELIRKYDIDAELKLSTNHGFIYVYPFSISYNRMTESDRKTMKRWGWIEAVKSWAFYV